MMEIVFASIIVTIAAFTIFRLNSITPFIRVTFSRDEYLNGHLKYQIALLFLASIVLLLAYFQNPTNFSVLLSLGNISAPAKPVAWFGIGENRSWLFAGLYLSIIITLGTLTFVYFQFRHLKMSVSEVFPYVGWILLFSLTNSFSEEVIFRIGIISPSMGTIDASYIALISAAIFGLAHFSGMPHGLIGMFMAGFLGWFLAKSVMETHGIFWAWSIHLFQDVVIYIGFILSRISQTQYKRADVYG
ncbi:MAG: CPBP family intramembrane metalloprotease [Candidatus Thiodiazotropha lotti]|nr:CPBP family intramembrane metalloprotease [Candidatus Thiodiazotropha lotti]